MQQHAHLPPRWHPLRSGPGNSDSLLQVLRRLHKLQHARKQGGRRGHVARLPLRRRQRIIQHYHLS